MIVVEITCPSIEDFISELSASGVALTDVQRLEMCTFSAGIEKCHYATLLHLAKLRGNTVKIRKNIHFRIFLVHMLNRPVFVCGILLLFALTILLPDRILFIKVEGNSVIHERNIIACAEGAGITFGINRRDIRSEEIKNSLLSELPMLQWAGINTHGCVAVISVRERTSPSTAAVESGVGSIVSYCDGIVCNITVKRGTATCSVGDAVKKGQLLVSGYTDCGLFVKAEKAEGSVFALTQHNLSALTINARGYRRMKTQQFSRYSLKIGKKLIKFYNGSSNSETECGKICREYYLRLPGGFALPIALVQESLVTYSVESSQIQDDLLAWLPVCLDNYLYEQMVDGDILKRVQTNIEGDHPIIYSCQYYCREMIGRPKDEEILQ